MKKTIYLLAFIFGLSGLAACSDDEGTPVYTEPSTFVLNMPSFASGIYDLKNTETVELTCSQPDYGYTASTTYTVEVSLDQSFENFVSLDTKYQTARMAVNAQEIAVAISNLLGVDESAFPTTTLPLYIRLKAYTTTDMKVEIKGSAITSNVIELPRVLPYYALPAITLPQQLYLIGTGCDWDWTKCFAMTPVHSNDGMFWSVQYFGKTADGGNGAFKLNYATAWDGNDVGINKVTISEASKTLAGITGTDNIEVANEGWYIVVATVTLDGRNYNYTVELYEPHVYLTGDPSGGYDEFTDDRLFTVPDGIGEFVSPAFKASGELRMCIKLENIDWWKTEFIILNGQIVFRGTGEDQERVSVNAGQKAYLDFINNTGSIK